MFRTLRLFRLTAGSAVGLAVAIILGLAGLLMLFGTMDEYRAGRAFDRAMDSYAEGDFDRVHAHLDESIAAKGRYLTPQEVKGKLFIDEGALSPSQYDEARELFRSLAEAQEKVRLKSGKYGPSLPVLIGRAVAELEADRATSATGLPSARAIMEARRRLERAAEEFPDFGDVYVNLATVALLEGNVAKCNRYLTKVRQVGRVSLDALPYLYNLHGLVELREGRLPMAVQEFEKVAQFAPDWKVPRLNLAAAYGESLLRGGLDRMVARRYATIAARTIADLRREQSSLVAPICHSLAVHYIRANQPLEALKYFEQAQKAAPHGELGWYARLNRAVAFYLAGSAAGPKSAQRKLFYAKARAELEKAIRNPLITSRDKFAAYCSLGTIAAHAGRHDAAIDYFHQADDLASRTAIAPIRQQLPRIQRTLAGLYYATGQGAKAAEYFEKTKALPDPRHTARAILSQLRAEPSIARFQTRFDKVHTKYDVSVGAHVAVRSTNVRLDPKKDIRLTLYNAVTGDERPIPLLLEGMYLRAHVVNLPQGRFTFRLKVTDHFGNLGAAETEAFAIDREPPRFVDREPAAGGTAAKVGAIKFRVVDTIGKVDPSSLSVMLRSPGGAQKAIVSRGRYRYASADGTIKVNDPVTENVAAPLPKVAVQNGAYMVIARVSDQLGKQAEATWSFTIR